MPPLTPLARAELVLTLGVLVALVALLLGQPVPGVLVLGLLLGRLAVRYARQQAGELQVLPSRWLVDVGLMVLLTLVVLDLL